jgi:gag-polyprotein putative aspartyl protease
VSFPFNPHQELIIVRAELEGPSGTGNLRLALDTGASTSLISAGMLVTVGYDPALAPQRVQITTGSGVEFVPRITVQKLLALGQERTGVLVLCHTLPASAGVDGLLGLDFFRGHLLTIDFGDVRIIL